MHRLFRLLPFAVALVFAAPAARAADDTVVATVNGQPVTEGELTAIQTELESAFDKIPEDKKMAAALSALIEIRLMVEDATKQGIDKKPALARKIALLRERALHAAYIEDQVAGKVTEEEIRARYDKEIAAAPPVNEVRASHILVDEKAKADEIIKKLNEGADFAALAKENSKDGSAAEGGDLGFFGPGRMVPEFEKAAFALEVGAYTKEAVQSQFGWHVIKVTDKRQQVPPPYDQVKEQVKGAIITEKYFALVKSMREGAKIEVPDAALKAGLDEIEAQKAKQ
ncbi:MAG: peptidylprolyl isomerase [Phyllobacteriaceae bacterium]|nr:peptidylprolyl isomerase [Phyllobacteriaceae bacterium]